MTAWARPNPPRLTLNPNPALPRDSAPRRSYARTPAIVPTFEKVKPMTITPDNLVRREVYYCVSSLVSTLANGAYALPSKRHGLTDGADELGALSEQAMELVRPIDDWEEAAREAGWIEQDGEWLDLGDPTDPICADSAQDACDKDGIEPYEREVFEHWIVSDWLADKLAEKGEKVDKDFAGMTIWARTTTGQGIASDWVIEAICADLNKAEA